MSTIDKHLRVDDRLLDSFMFVVSRQLVSDGIHSRGEDSEECHPCLRFGSLPLRLEGSCHVPSHGFQDSQDGQRSETLDWRFRRPLTSLIGDNPPVWYTTNGIPKKCALEVRQRRPTELILYCTSGGAEGVCSTEQADSSHCEKIRRGTVWIGP